MKEVVIKNVIIFDQLDISCLAWFIEAKIKLDLTKAYVSPDALDALNQMCVNFSKRNIKAMEGSTIIIPLIGGYSGMGRSDDAKDHCKTIGFEAIVSP